MKNRPGLFFPGSEGPTFRHTAVIMTGHGKTQHSSKKKAEIEEKINGKVLALKCLKVQTEQSKNIKEKATCIT